MTTRFQAIATAPTTRFGVARKMHLEDLPEFYAWASAHLLPEFDRQLVIGSAAETLAFLTQIWPVDTGRSVRSWEAGVNSIPRANNPPGPRPGLTRQAVEDRLSGVRAGDEVIVANHARKGDARTSYAELLWNGWSRQMPAGAERPLERHLRSVQNDVVKRAETRALGGVA